MKITTRIISGYGMFIAVLAGLVTYQLITLWHLRSIIADLSGNNFEYSRTCAQAFRDRDLVEEYTRKSFALADPDYWNGLKEHQRNFEATLAELTKKAPTDEERTAVKRLTRLWESYSADLRLWQQKLPGSEAVLPTRLQEGLEQLRTQIDSIFDASKRSIAAKQEHSRKTAQTATYVLLCATFVALATSVVVSFLIFRSISKPLAHLTEGTRAIAEGKFFYRLDTSRNDEFSQVARDFNRMTLRLNELDKLKRDFISHVSHELKSPLASMRETTQLLLEQIPGPLTEKQKRLLTLNLRSGQRLTSMIGNLLDLSKMEAGVVEYELKSQDLVPLIRTAIAELEVQAREREIQIEAALPDDPLLVECDGDRIVQVLVNLVGNAVKFSPQAGTVRIQAEAVYKVPESIPERWRRVVAGSANSGHFAMVTISDSGPGIPDSDREKVFEKFQQLRQGKKMAGQGAGLGLAISRTIVQSHRGAIWVEDNPSGGSRFALLLRPGGSIEKTIPGASFPI
jgi:two-component system sensor histidine kinase GlrK